MFVLLVQKFRSIVKSVSPAGADTPAVSMPRVERNAVNCPSLHLLATSRDHDDNCNVSSASHAWDCRKSISLTSRNA
jgi:hypothetical protein